MERKCIQFKMQDGELKKGELSGYGAVFGNVDHGGDIIERGAFAESLAKHAEDGTMPAMLWSHDTWSPIGGWKSVTEDSRGLVVSGCLWVEGNDENATPVPDAAKAYNIARSNSLKGLSIGYIATVVTWEDVDGERIRTIKKAELLEISVVVFAMNELATITDVKSGENTSKNKRIIEKTLINAGLSKKQAKTLLSGGYDAMDCDDSEQKQRDAEIGKLKDLLNTQTQEIKELIA